MHIATAVPSTAAAISDRWLSISDAFLAQAATSPSALAVESGEARYTYAELAARVELFAARLAARLVDGGRLVGVCLHRDIDLPAWLLAIFRVGGAYLPLDPSLPETRLGHVLEDGAPALIVASRSLAPLFSDADVPLMIAEDDEDVPPAPQFALTPDTLAYVIFTSGSTGRPKGVEIEHGSLAALMRTMVDLPGLARGERMLGLTRISFDLSVPDLFLPFYAGGALTLLDLDAAGDPAQLAAAFERYRPDLVQATPSTWLTLLEGGWQGLAGLRVLAGGEALSRALADRLLPRCAALWNIYGPTETTVWSACYRVEAGDGPVPIGWPMNGYDVRVVDAALQPVAKGESGEIVIGGIGVARGYRGRPDLTRERFVTTSAGERLYRTGDVGCVGVDGRLFCLGRLDDQVKVRGFRIELGDVEAALALHDDVAWCAVRLWTDAAGAAVLTGYVVPRSETVLETRAIKAFLAQHLAPYMLPDRILAIAAMPLTPNGKVDRNALPSPFADSDVTLEVPSGNDTESRLGVIWCELLGIAYVAGDDDFFDLGGYSLMTVRLGRRIEATFGARLAPIDLLQHSTLRAMAQRIERGSPVASSAVMPLNAPGARPPLYWLDAGPLMRTLMRGLPGGQPAFSLNLDAEDEELLGSSTVSIAAVAERLRLRLAAVQPSGPYYIGGWCRWGIVAYELAQQLVARGETVALLVLLDADRPQQTLRRRGRLLNQWLRQRGTRHAELASFSQRVEAATHRYDARRYGGDVLLLRASNASADGGWGSLVSGNLEVARSEGDHLTMVRAPHVTTVAAQIGSALSEVQLRLGVTPLT